MMRRLRNWKEAVVAYSWYYPGKYLEGLSETAIAGVPAGFPTENLANAIYV
jgi:hypothetical protein